MGYRIPAVVVIAAGFYVNCKSSPIIPRMATETRSLLLI